MKTAKQWANEEWEALNRMDKEQWIKLIQQDAQSEMRMVLESVAELAPTFLDNEKGHFSKLVARALTNNP